MKKLLLILALAVLAIALISPLAAAADYPGGSGHWAEGSIARCDNLGILTGLTESTGNLNLKLPRAEMFKLMDNVMRYQNQAKNSYSDLRSSHVHYNVILRLTQAGVLTGYENGRIQADSPITREEAVVLFARMFHVAPDAAAANKFSDSYQVGEWAKPLVGGMKAAGFIQGSRNEFHPKDTITLGEVTTILNNMLNTLITRSGHYEQNSGYGYTVVNAAGVLLEDMAIAGDLLIAPGVGEGEITLDNVSVRGNIIVLGGGENSLILKGNSSASDIYAYKEGGTVHIRVYDGADVAVVHIESGSDKVILEGSVDELLMGADTEASLQNASINDIFLDGADSSLSLNRDSYARRMRLEGNDISVIVQGEVGNINVDGNSVEISGRGVVDKVKVDDGDHVRVDVIGADVEVSRQAGKVQAGNYTIESGDSGTVGEYDSGSSSSNSPRIDTTAYYFDKHNPWDIGVGVYLGTKGREASGIYSVAAGSYVLRSGTDYSFSNKTLTLKQNYLMSLAVGRTSLTVTFNNRDRTTVNISLTVNASATYTVGFRVAELTNNGIKFSAAADKSRYSPGETVTITVNLSLNAAVAASGIQRIGLQGSHAVSPSASYDKYVEKGQALSAPTSYSFTFTMPSANVVDVAVTSDCLSDTTASISGSPTLTAFTAGATSFTLNTVNVPNGTDLLVTGLPQGVSQTTWKTTGNRTEVTLAAGQSAPFVAATNLKVSISGVDVQGTVTLAMVIKNIIENISIHTTAPAAGDAAATAGEQAPAGATGPAVRWDEGFGNWGFSGNFAYHTQYRSQYVYQATAGCSFDSDIDVQVDGSGTVAAVKMSGDKQTLTVEVIWPETAAAPSASAKDELAKLQFNGIITMPLDTDNNQAAVESILLPLAQAQVSQEFVVSIVEDSSRYAAYTKVWRGRFKVSETADPTNTASDTGRRKINVDIQQPIGIVPVEVIPVEVDPPVEVTPITVAPPVEVIPIEVAPPVAALSITVDQRGVIQGDTATAAGRLTYALVAEAQANATAKWSVSTDQKQAEADLRVELKNQKPTLSRRDNGKVLVVVELKDGLVIAVGKAAVNINR